MQSARYVSGCSVKVNIYCLGFNYCTSTVFSMPLRGRLAKTRPPENGSYCMASVEAAKVKDQKFYHCGTSSILSLQCYIYVLLLQFLKASEAESASRMDLARIPKKYKKITSYVHFLRTSKHYELW